ncbi:hypothetical protein BDV59DRAFT_30818 [Aspergillus ambiguus]|uniref:uncharacterized protein n=1 Tax=Aspergillus ambiguus TaxID=176160 RepID=UPI003CCD270D
MSPKMAGACESDRASSPSGRILDLYFSGPREDFRLQHLDTSGIDSHREQSFKYRLALERKEALASHLGAHLLNDSFEDGFRKVFGACKPSLVPPVDREVDVPSPSWVDVLQDVEPSQLQPNANGTQHCLVRGITVALTAPDCDIIRSGLLQKFIEPWPHPQDLQAEIEAVEATIRCLSTWKQNVLQGMSMVASAVAEYRLI